MQHALEMLHCLEVLHMAGLVGALQHPAAKGMASTPCVECLVLKESCSWLSALGGLILVNHLLIMCRHGVMFYEGTTS